MAVWNSDSSHLCNNQMCALFYDWRISLDQILQIVYIQNNVYKMGALSLSKGYVHALNHFTCTCVGMCTY